MTVATHPSRRQRATASRRLAARALARTPANSRCDIWSCTSDEPSTSWRDRAPRAVNKTSGSTIACFSTAEEPCTNAGKRRRYRCVGCGQTFSPTKGTPYYRLQHRRTTFDTVVTLRVEGVSLSAIARAERLAWNTVARWLERAASVCRRCNHGRTTGFVAAELQADEIRSFTGGKTRPTWVFAAIEVWSRLWTSTVVGRRSYRNTLALVGDVATRMTFGTCPMIVTDGFEFYGTAIRRVFGPVALYAQVIKTRRHDRVVRVERRAVIGAAWRCDDALAHSEDSSTVNTSLIERLNLTIRQSSAYLSRRTLAHARATDTLDAHLELLRCYYNFVRPHGALKFGRETRTPAMQAGLATRRLTLRDIFVSLRPVIPLPGGKH